MNNLFSSKDILLVFGADRKISGRLNKLYLHLQSKVERNKNVMLEDRDAIYYAGLTILRHEILDYMSLLSEFKECKLISQAKYVAVVHILNDLIKDMESECVYN